ncbi:lipocalin [Tropicibacter sp. S64]|uniref:lipocalin n=1 Tax=Tropicibacter sp. S64 TaxID=3415122 RepID=UPI003C7994BA
MQDLTIPVRNPTAQVASQADVTLDRLSGDWVVVEGYGIAPGARIRIADGLFVLDGRPMPMVVERAGRLMVQGRPVWVHWLDVDNRTAALGDPNGSQVWIMDRTGKPGERRQAARDILAWYGYDLGRMQSE